MMQARGRDDVSVGSRGNGARKAETPRRNGGLEDTVWQQAGRAAALVVAEPMSHNRIYFVGGYLGADQFHLEGLPQSDVEGSGVRSVTGHIILEEMARRRDRSALNGVFPALL